MSKSLNDTDLLKKRDKLHKERELYRDKIRIELEKELSENG